MVRLPSHSHISCGMRYCCRRHYWLAVAYSHEASSHVLQPLWLQQKWRAGTSSRLQGSNHFFLRRRAIQPGFYWCLLVGFFLFVFCFHQSPLGSLFNVCCLLLLVLWWSLGCTKQLFWVVIGCNDKQYSFHKTEQLSIKWSCCQELLGAVTSWIVWGGGSKGLFSCYQSELVPEPTRSKILLLAPLQPGRIHYRVLNQICEGELQSPPRCKHVWCQNRWLHPKG